MIKNKGLKNILVWRLFMINCESKHNIMISKKFLTISTSPQDYDIENGKNFFSWNIGMWGVYQKNFDWEVGAIPSKFDLDVSNSRKSPKTFKILHFGFFLKNGNQKCHVIAENWYISSLPCS